MKTIYWSIDSCVNLDFLNERVHDYMGDEWLGKVCYGVYQDMLPCKVSLAHKSLYYRDYHVILFAFLAQSPYLSQAN